MGALVTFWDPPPPWKSPRGYDFSSSTRYQGEVVAVGDNPPVGPGKVPDLWLEIVGETGATKRISVVHNQSRFIE